MNPRTRSSSRPQTGKKKVRKARPAARQARARPRRSASAKALDNLLDSLRAVTAGDFSVRLTPEAQPRSMEELAHAFNALVGMNQRMQDELVRVERVVGREGQMAERASLGHVSGGWASSLGSINSLIADLVQPTTEVARVLDAVARGDLTQKMALDLPGQPVKGEFLRIGTTVNAMVEQLSSFAAEVTRVAREVGTEGKLGGQARVPGVAGTWKDLTDSVNQLANNLTAQVRNIAEVTTSVARGDLSRKITVDARGEVLELKNTVNTMVDQLRSFAGEVTRVAKEVGTEGKLGGQADVPGVSGVWKDLTDNVNLMATNLTTQVRGIVKVVTAVANGDLSQRLVVDAKGEVAALADTLNSMTKTLGIFADQVTSVAKTVGVEGKLGAQADVPGVAGTWKDLTDNVNLLANNLTAQVRNIAEVSTAVARGDLSKKITVDARGEVLELKNTINTMVEQLRSFAGEVTRVAREVGTEGKLGGQADVPGVSGTWKGLTDNVNFMASNLTSQVRNIALVTTAVANGDLSRKITVDVKGEILELKDTINTMVDQLRSFAAEVTRVAKEVGTEGKLGGQAEVQGVSGVWEDLTDSVNSMASNLTNQVRNIAKVTTAVAMGDLSKKITVDAKGEILELKDTINTMVDQLNAFASEVTRVAREVGTEGKLGGQARVPGVAGTWKDLTDNVNLMARNLTTQVRGIVRVVTAVANGDLTQKLVVDAKGEVAALADTINSMTDTLGIFAQQVSSVAREVGIEGKLGGQAKVPGARGAWRQLTDNVNQLAGNLTTQVRAISEVATAVTKGDLTRSISVDAQGEVAALKDNINQMIVNLKETTQKNTEQDWLKTNLAKFSGMMQGQKNLEAVSQLIMSELTPLVSAHHGAFFLMDTEDGVPVAKLTSSYAYRERKTVANRFRLGESLVGQCALEKKTLLLTHVPADYIRITSGLGEATPLNIIVLPVLFEGAVKAVIELASFHPFSTIHQIFLDQLTESIGVVLNMIMANMRTEELLRQSQSLANELQSQSRELTQQQQELKRSNSALEAQALELEEKAKLLVQQNIKVEEKNREVEQARSSLEEKAEQLSLISKYKSEFLANMSHELRTPLNSMLVLAKLLADNSEGVLNAKQVEYAETIYSSGGDLLSLINEILDLSKVEAGKMQVEPRDAAVVELVDFARRTFGPVAEQKNLGFITEVYPDVAATVFTDPKRLQQILKNLLSNAFKFTSTGQVTLRIRGAGEEDRFSAPELVDAEQVLAFSVIDTGIGIPEDKQKLIFEAFQQADGTTSRKYGGTGLGLSISRELARLLGGEIRVKSARGEGSTFTLYLPRSYNGLERGVETPADADVGYLPMLRELLPRGEVHDIPASSVTWVDDRNEVGPEDRVLLVAVSDGDFSRGLVDTAHQEGLKALVAPRGDVALSLAQRLKPSAIVLQLDLPILDGWSVLDRLKRDPRTRGIPVQVVSVDRLRGGSCVGCFVYLDRPFSPEALQGAFSHLLPPPDGGPRKLGLVDPRSELSECVRQLSLAGVPLDAKVLEPSAIVEALDQGTVDVVALDLSSPGGRGLKLLVELVRRPGRLPPVLLYSGAQLPPDDERRLRRSAESVLLESFARSPEGMLADMGRFMRRVGEQSRAIADARESRRRLLTGREVLLVDDDARNIFALTSVLENHGMRVTFAQDGRAAMDLLEKNPALDVVLLDVMMPEMDGYQAMRAIRADSRWASLPVIAITARALKDDREKCLEAGASDYLSKPVDIDRLLELLCRWVSPRGGN
ncbi:Two-component hybrid sensor and regulator [Cystobacter fuscus DSM 2262]|uniref:histidine kinase n=1 Tax=Cystobacter fuscus (strain ATCC 25194 / DSM 2262 / NBRC 100088 / M29) TaxID=1242864 RepID=S9P2U4_CYSF2|nr:HAMP domain-containing protein [Cystobacter fuscus]EPX57481.1 Two-component hybrid sensor and regulator [Cystobacter fuscus DSM 2262]